MASQLLQQAVAAHRGGHLQDAERLYDQVLLLDRDNVDALNLKGVVADAAGDRERAVALFSRALVVRPRFPEAHFNRANTLAALGRHDSALGDYRRAIALRADYGDAYLNAALLLLRLGRSDDAVTAFQRMVQRCPSDPRGHYGLAREVAARGKLAEAITLARRAVALKPDWPEAWSDLGSYLASHDDPVAAEAAYDRALSLAPDMLGPRVNRGLTRLGQGKLGAGFDDYVLRLADPENPFRPTDTQPWPWPSWQGEPLAGKRLLLWNEQGIGDAILYATMIPDIARQSACSVAVDPRLVPIFQRSFPAATALPFRPGDEIPPAGTQRGFDFQSTLLDAGRWLRRSFDDFPNPTPHLVADAVKSDARRQRYRADAGPGKLLVGLSWRSANPLVGHEKSLALKDLAPLLRTPDVQFYNVQYGDTAAELAALPDDIRIVTDRDVDAFQDISALADQLAALDLVVSVSNSTAHLAAALGRQTWVMLPAGRPRLWYWFREGDTSPWYAHARLYRQSRTANWNDMVTRLTHDLGAYAQRPGGHTPT